MEFERVSTTGSGMEFEKAGPAEVERTPIIKQLLQFPRGLAEVGATALTGIPAAVGGAVAGLGALAGSGGDYKAAVEAGAEFADKYTFKPTTEVGKAIAEPFMKMLGTPAEMGTEAIDLPLESWKAPGIVRYPAEVISQFGAYGTIPAARRVGRVTRETWGRTPLEVPPKVPAPSMEFARTVEPVSKVEAVRRRRPVPKAGEELFAEKLAQREEADLVRQEELKKAVEETVVIEEPKVEPVVEERTVQKLNTPELKEEEWKALEGTGVFAEEELATLRKAKPEAQREQYNRTFNIVPEAPELPPEELARVLAIQQRVHEANLARPSLSADMTTLKDFGYTEEEVGKMSQGKIKRLAEGIRNDIDPLKLTDEKVEKLEGVDEKLRNMLDKGVDKLTDEELDSLIADMKETDIDEVFDPLLPPSVFDKAIAAGSEVDMPTLTLDQWRNRYRMLEKKGVPIAQATGKAVAEKPKVVKRRRVVKEKEEEPLSDWEKEELAAKGEETEKGQAYYDQLLKEEGLGVYEPDRFDKLEKAPAPRGYADYISEVARLESEKARMTAERLLAKKVPFDKDNMDLLASVYKVRHETKAEALAWLKNIEAAEDRARANLPRRNAFTRRSIAKAISDGKITKEEGKYIEAITQALKVQPTFGWEYTPTLRGAGGVYELANNLIKMKSPSSAAHEVAHWWFFKMDRADRARYYQDYIGQYYKEDGTLDVEKLRRISTDSYNAQMNPAELFAVRMTDYLHDYVLTPTEKTLLMKLKEFWGKVKEGIFKKTKRDYSDISDIFDKVLDDKNRRVWAEGDENGPIYIRPVTMEQSTFPQLERPTVTDMLGLRNLSNRVAEMIKTHRQASKDHAGNRILKELGGVKVIRAAPEEQLRLGFSPSFKARGKAIERPVNDIIMADEYAGYMYGAHDITLRDAEHAFQPRFGDIFAEGWRTMGSKDNVRKVLEHKMEGTPAEQEAAGKVRDWLDTMRARYKVYLKTQYKQRLSKQEYNALLDLINGRTKEEVDARYPKLPTSVIEQLAKDYKEIDNWGIDEYVPNVMRGNFRIMVDKVGEDGKATKSLIAVGLNEADAVRKAEAWLLDPENAGYKGNITVDTDFKHVLDDRTSVSPRQYGIMYNKLGKQLEASVESINKQLGQKLAKTALSGRFKVTPSEKFSPFVLEREDILPGEENLLGPKSILRSYAYSMERKMALDPVINNIRRDMYKYPKEQREYLLRLLEDVKGKYWKADEVLDRAINSMSRRVQARYPEFAKYFPEVHGAAGKASQAVRSFTNAVKLGYRPVAGFVNLASGQLQHAWVKAGTKRYAEAVQWLKTPEGETVMKGVRPYLGVSLVELASGKAHLKEPIYKPLGLFQRPEPFNREVSAAHNYLQAKREGKTNEAAFEAALRGVRLEQFIYNVSDLPQFMRGPVGKLVMQYKPYLMKELEFVSSLRGAEVARYLAAQVALAGPRGYIMIMKSLPILAAMGWWQDMWDYVEENMKAGARAAVGEKAAPLLTHGLGGVPSLIDPSWGIDISGPATMAFPTSEADLSGPFLSTMQQLKDRVFDPVFQYGPYDMDVMHMEDPVVIMKHYNRLWELANHLYNKRIDNVLTENYWVKDQHGNDLYEVKDMIPFIVQSVAGAENIELSNIRREEAILTRRRKITAGERTRLLDKAIKQDLTNDPGFEDTVEKMYRAGMTDPLKSINKRIYMMHLPPEERRLLQADVESRIQILDLYPTQSQDSTP